MAIQEEVPFVHQKALEICRDEIRDGILRLVFSSLYIKEITEFNLISNNFFHPLRAFCLHCRKTLLPFNLTVFFFTFSFKRH